MKQSISISHAEQQEKTISLLRVILGSLFMVVCAQVKIPLGFLNPIPFTLQTIAVMLLAGTLGRKEGALSMLLYLAYVTAGLPVLAGWNSSVLTLVGPKGGYYLGYVAQAFLVGTLYESRWKNNLSLVFLSLGAISMLQLLLGVAQLSCFIPLASAFSFGCTPFIPIEFVKILLVVGYFHQKKSL